MEETLIEESKKTLKSEAPLNMLEDLEIEKNKAKISEERARKSMKEWQDTFDSISDQIFIQDTNFKILRVNKACADALNRKPEELIGKKCYEIMHKTKKPWLTCPTARTLKSKKPCTEEVDDPNIGIPLLISSYPILDEKGNISRVVHIAKDISKQKKVEEELRIKNNAVESSISGIGMTDMDGKITYVNDAIVNMWGYKNKDEIIGRGLSEFWQGKRVLQTIKNLKEKGMDKGEDIGKRKDGSEFNVLFSANVIKDEKDKPVAMMGAFMDITEKKKAELLLENIFNLSPDMIAVCTTEGKFLKVNPSWTKIMGYTEKELLKLGWAKLVHPDDVKRTNKEVEMQLKGSSAVNFVNRYRCKDGSYKTLEWQATFAKGGIVYATARDITDRMKVEKSLEESERKYKALFENVKGAIFITDPQTRDLIDCNKAAEKLMGYTKKQILSMKVDQLLPRDILKKAMESFKKAAEGKTKNVETEVLTKDKKRIPVNISMAPIIVGDKRYMFGIFRVIGKR